MAESGPIVAFRGVRKTYDGRSLVVKDLNLDVIKGEFLTLLGPSGSGKTTSLMMLAGFETPTQGDILLAGQSIARTPPHKRNIGMVFQNYALFPHMTVAENVAFPLSVRGVPKAERETRVTRALDMIKLGNLGGRKPAQLSGGQQQRVALARALVFEPAIVLMDEPLGALDKQLREHMQIEIKHLHERLGVTVVYVTHDQDEALTISNRIAVFNDGVIQQLDTPTRLYEAPRNSFVASFIGENNAIPARIVALQDGIAQVCLPDGSSIAAQAVAALEPGAATSISIRPEKILLEGVAPGGPNTVEATTVETIYHGDHMRVRADTGYAALTIKMRFRAGRPVPQAGERLWLELPTADCRALDAAPAMANSGL
ncbi:ABC transporter ATP-binding protein [Oleomonas cavernae]|uniref:Spermidine/putrescine import ATP-binding protein PotA n=1 Tax=Oleomonas cavernae TaxID=2320859 RepID=A0A418WT82_9PROT|nr:ABC transporter ATP-binding protein [Oleomonas cavernae]RJF94417.1 ABC transporter ATP-binding protein [Oleomonas cavernae]